MASFDNHVFKSLPDWLFDSLRDFVLARSSKEHGLTIRIEGNSAAYCFAAYCGAGHTNMVSAEHIVWLQQHVNVERVHCEHK
jgi:hypothetical protein